MFLTFLILPTEQFSTLHSADHPPTSLKSTYFIPYSFLKSRKNRNNFLISPILMARAETFTLSLFQTSMTAIMPACQGSKPLHLCAFGVPGWKKNPTEYGAFSYLMLVVGLTVFELLVTANRKSHGRSSQSPETLLVGGGVGINRGQQDTGGAVCCLLCMSYMNSVHLNLW